MTTHTATDNTTQPYPPIGAHRANGHDIINLTSIIAPMPDRARRVRATITRHAWIPETLGILGAMTLLALAILLATIGAPPDTTLAIALAAVASGFLGYAGHLITPTARR
jgi:hypothetical protein